MTADSVEGLLLRDDQGQYYLVARELLQQCRVPADQGALLKQQLAGDEVSGYSGSSGGDRPTESLSLNFTKIAFGAFSLGVQSPRDSATGQASGKRQWGPI